MLGLGHRLAAAGCIVVMAVWVTAYMLTIAAARLPDNESGLLNVVFLPGTSAAEAMTRIVASGGHPMGEITDWIWTAAGTEPGFVGRLRRSGALIVLRELPAGPALVGCFGGIVASRATAYSRFAP